jgi:hypothetical protein
VGHRLQAAQRGDGEGLELVRTGNEGAADAAVLDLLPDPLVGVELRGVPGELEQPQLPVGGGGEGADFLGSPAVSVGVIMRSDGRAAVGSSRRG